MYKKIIMLWACLGALGLLTSCDTATTPQSDTAEKGARGDAAIEVVRSREASASASDDTDVLKGAALRGKTVHDANCISCHATQVYQRDGRKVRNLRQLNKQVERCSANLAEPLSAEALEEVSAYLNQAFYHFDARDY